MGKTYILLGVLMQHAPNKSAQSKCAEIYNQLKADGFSDMGVERILARMLVDGLDHASWPWMPGYTVPLNLIN